MISVRFRASCVLRPEWWRLGQAGDLKAGGGLALTPASYNSRTGDRPAHFGKGLPRATLPTVRRCYRGRGHRVSVSRTGRAHRSGCGFTQPLFVTAAPGDTNPNRLYVVEKGGTSPHPRHDGGGVGTPGTTFLNLTSVLGAGQVLTGSEQGLLGMAFGPGFSNGNGFVVRRLHRQQRHHPGRDPGRSVYRRPAGRLSPAAGRTF